MPQKLTFRQLPGHYAIVHLAPNVPIPEWAAQGDFTSITRTADELSIVCPIENIPSDVPYDPSWICLKLEGPFPFTQTGVLLSFLEPLSNNGIPIFTISTFDTDYVLIPQQHATRAVDLLREAGQELIADEV